MFGGGIIPIYKDKIRHTYYFRTFVIENGIKKQKKRCGFLTKNLAKQAELELISKYNNNNNNNNNFYTNIKFNDLYIEYIKYKHQKLKDKSYYSIKNKFENHILPFFKNKNIFDITAIDYINFKEYMLEKNLSYKYCSCIHTLMVNILNYASNFYNLKENVASKVGNFSNKNDIKKTNIWSYEEFKRFYNCINDLIFSTLFLTLFNTGMRIGECISLTWKDIEEDNININKTYVGNKNGVYIFNTPKTKSSIRTIKLDNTTFNKLNELKKYYSNMVEFNPNWYVFGGIKPLSLTTINRKKKYFCDLAKIYPIKLHEFRHSHATILISNGIPITLVSKRLGHNNITTTLNIYSHCIPNDEQRAITLLNSINKNLY